MAQRAWREGTADHRHLSEKSRISVEGRSTPESRPAVFYDSRLKSVEWRDLVSVRRIEVIAEPLLPATWLVASLVMAGLDHYVVALGCSFFFFLTGLRLVTMPFTRRSGCPAGPRIWCFGS